MSTYVCDGFMPGSRLRVLGRLQEGLDIKNFKSEMFLKVIRHPVASAIFYDKVIRTFKGVCCGFPKEHQYSQDYDGVTNLPKGFYGLLDAVTGKREESGRRAHHLHGLMVSRYVKLHNVKQVMDEGGAKVMEWMSSVASWVMSEYVARQKLKDGTYATVNPEITMGMTGEPKYIDHNKTQQGAPGLARRRNRQDGTGDHTPTTVASHTLPRIALRLQGREEGRR